MVDEMMRNESITGLPKPKNPKGMSKKVDKKPM